MNSEIIMIMAIIFILGFDKETDLIMIFDRSEEWPRGSKQDAKDGFIDFRQRNFVILVCQYHWLTGIVDTGSV